MSTQQFESLLYTITASTVQHIIAKTGWSENEALEKFTTSNLYKALEDAETDVWHYSSTMLSFLFFDEMEGNLVFPEV